MAEQKIQQLLVLAVKSVKAGDKEKGRQVFLAALKLDPNNETAWMGLVSVPKDNKERLTALKKLLTLNPNHEKALAVLDKLGIPPERLGIAPSAMPDPEPIDEPQPDPDFDDGTSMFDEPDADDDSMSMFGEPDDYDNRMSMFESAAFADDDEIDSQPSAFVSESFDEQMDEPEPEQPEIPEHSVFELPPPMLGTEVGVPVADSQALGRVTQEVEQLVNEYLASEYEFDNIQWVRKTKRRAGEADIWKWRAQVFGVIALILIVFVGVPGMLFISSPEGQRVVFAPTHTQTPTFTFTPSHTPGITPTPSSVPQQTFTPSPTIIGIAETLNPNISPAPTEIYAPGSVFVGPNILEARDLIRNEQYQAAFELLEDEKASQDPGYPYPYYLQSQIDLLQDDPEKAQEKLEAGEALISDLSSDVVERFMPLYHLGYGEIRMYEGRQALAEGRAGDANSLFNEAKSRFQQAIDLDGEIIPAYIQLARVQVLQEDYNDAISTLNIAIEGELSNLYFENTLLRTERGRVYFAEGDYDRALQEANDALYFEKWAEAAYILQAESALALNSPGQANNFLDAYQLAYPDSLLAYKFEGDAYRIEGKADQALFAYNVALQDNEDRADYFIVLEALADLYFDQRRYDLAEASYSEYLDNRDDNRIRSKRMLAAYSVGDYDVALRDIERLTDTRVVSNGDLALLEGQILTDTAETLAEYNTAFEKLTEAVLTFGVSEESRPIAEEYLARVNFELDDFDQALLNINRSLIAEETGSRRYLKGQILQAQENYEDARTEFEFLIAWGEIFPYPFLEDVQNRYDEVVDLIENPPEEADGT